MPRKGVGWPSVGQVSQDANEHSTIVINDARRLLEFGAPSEVSPSGKQCPYQTLADFCTSVLAYMEWDAQQTSPNKQQIGPSLHGSNSSPNSVSTIRQDSADLNFKRDTIEPKIAPATYGVLVLYVPSNFDVANQKRAINGITSSNKGFIPGLEIRSIEWLIPEWTKTKHYGSLLVEFTYPEHANAAIREQLLVGNKVLACEYYERNSRLRQCKTCQQYGHLETQCTSEPACGRCAEPHLTADCRKRDDPKNYQCATCHGPHRAWDNVCDVRQEELDLVRLARANRPEYHPEPRSNPKQLENQMDDVQSRDFTGTRRYSIDYLIEVNIRGGRKSHARLRGRGGRGQGLPPDFRENPELQEQQPVPALGRSTRKTWGRNGKAPFDSNRYSAQAAARAGCLRTKTEVQSNLEGDECMQSQIFGWGQSGMKSMKRNQRSVAPSGPGQPRTSPNSILPLRSGAVTWVNRQNTDSWR